MISWIFRISAQRALDLYEELRVSFGERFHQQLSDNLEVRSWMTRGSSNSLSILNRRCNGATKRSAPSSSKANLCQWPPHTSASLTAPCAISSRSSAPASVWDGRPPFRCGATRAARRRTNGTTPHRPVVADCRLLGLDRDRPIRTRVAGLFLFLPL